MTRTLFIVCASCALIAQTACGENWTQYRGPSGDGVSAESIGSLDWPVRGPRQLWKVETPNGFSSFSVADGRAVTMVSRDIDGTRTEVCIALDAESGKTLWSVPFSPCEYDHAGGDSGAQGNRGGDGPRSTPATDGTRVYVYDSQMLLSCLDAETGDTIWSHGIIQDYEGKNVYWRNAISPVIDEETVYVSGGGEGQAFLAFKKTTGELQWKSGNDRVTHATPRIATIHGQRQLIQFANPGLVSLNPVSGQELWRADFEFRTSTAASPIVSHNFVYCSAGYSVGAGLFEIATEGDSFTAKKVWRKQNKLMNHWSTPVLHNGYLYGIFGFKKYGRAPLECVELKTGEVRWSERGFGPGNLIIAGDTLLVLSDDGQLVAAEASPTGYRELARTKAIEGKCWSTPAFSNGRVYVRSTQEAVCLDLSGE